jgi:copper transport protein
LAESLDWQNIRLIAVESRWGQSWIRQAAAGVAMLATFGTVKASLKGGWGLAVLAVALMILTLPLTGHAAGSIGRQAVHAVHVTGAGLWLGSLAVLRFDASRTPKGRATDLSAFHAFAGVAMTGVAVLVLSGLVVSSLYVGTPSHLVSSAYGRTLLLKVALVLGAVWCGYRNWRDLHGTAPSPPISVPRRVTQELLFGTLVVIVTGVLTGLAHP